MVSNILSFVDSVSCLIIDGEIDASAVLVISRKSTRNRIRGVKGHSLRGIKNAYMREDVSTEAMKVKEEYIWHQCNVIYCYSLYT